MVTKVKGGVLDESALSGKNMTGDIAFDTSTLKIDSSNNRVGIGTASPDELLVVDGAAKIKGTNKLSFTNTSDQTYIHAPASNTIALGTSSAEQMRLDSSGRLMIGTTTEGRANEGADMFTIGDDGSNNSGMTMRSGTSGYGSIYFSDATSGTGEYAGYVQYAHNGDMMLLATNSTTRIRLDSDGLKFGSDSAAANALDDYEEGTWTPTINAGTLSGAETGYYTKIGRQVTIQYHFNVTTLGSSGTQIIISGLPFTSVNATNISGAGCLVARYFTGNQIVSLVQSNSTNMVFYDNNNGNYDEVSFGEVEPTYDADFAVYGTHTYFTG